MPRNLCHSLFKRRRVVIYSIVIRSFSHRFPFPEGKTMGKEYNTKCIKNGTTVS